jgi:hypothetical protein
MVKKKIVVELEEGVWSVLQPYTEAERNAYIEALLIRDFDEGTEQRNYMRVQEIKQAMVARLNKEEKKGETK